MKPRSSIWIGNSHAHFPNFEILEVQGNFDILVCRRRNRPVDFERMIFKQYTTSELDSI